MDGMRNEPNSNLNPEPASPPQQPASPPPQPSAPASQPQPWTPVSQQQPAAQDPAALPPAGQDPMQNRPGSSFAIGGQNKRKKWLPYAIIGGVLALLLIIAGAAYALYQQPNTVLK